MNLLVQPLFNFLLCWVPVARHQTSLRQIPDSATKPFVGYVGPDRGSAVSLTKKISVLLAHSATVCGARTEVSPEVVWEGAGTRFPHPRDVLMKVLEVRGSNLRACAAPRTSIRAQIQYYSDLYSYCTIALVLKLTCEGPIFFLLHSTFK